MKTIRKCIFETNSSSSDYYYDDDDYFVPATSYSISIGVYIKVTFNKERNWDAIKEKFPSIYKSYIEEINNMKYIKVNNLKNIMDSYELIDSYDEDAITYDLDIADSDVSFEDAVPASWDCPCDPGGYEQRYTPNEMEGDAAVDFIGPLVYELNKAFVDYDIDFEYNPEDCEIEIEDLNDI